MPPAKVAARSASVREYTKAVERERVELHPHLKKWVEDVATSAPPAGELAAEAQVELQG